MSIENINFDFSTNYQLNTTHSLTQREYKDTQREDLSRRKITINNQTGNIIDANIEFYPAKDTDVDGTPITAAILREFHNVIAQADQNAKSSFNMTNEIANRVANYLTQANTNVQVLESQITNSQGTKVTVGGANNYVSVFDADTKADVTTPIIAKVNYNATTDTFMF